MAGRGTLSRRTVITGLGAFAASTQARAEIVLDADGQFRFGSSSSPATPRASAPAARPLRQLGAPDFDLLHQDSPFVAGVRPHRDGGMRLEAARPIDTDSGRKFIIHNYGHGGAGLSLSFGAADKVRDILARIVAANFAHSPLPELAVIGAGVIGLVTGHEILERWPQARITIYAAECDGRKTTSYIAGGRFAHISEVAEATDGAARAELARCLARSEDRLAQLARTPLGDRFGIMRVQSYSLAVGSSGGNVRIATGAATHAATEYASWLIDPTRLMPNLKEHLEKRQVQFVQRSFAAVEDVHALPQSVIINCTGLGAGALFSDPAIEPRRGHLVVLRNPGKLRYMLNSWCGDSRTRYLFARHDDIVIGGTIQRGNVATSFDPADISDINACDRILRSAKALFIRNGEQC